MKILEIRINNLASLEGETVIDFTTEPLASAGIFAITGPTGAGKSTILDALCLALYGRTPRYVQAGARRGIELQDSSGDTIQQGDPRAILRDGTAEGSASVKFVGMDGDHYEAAWAVRRAHLKVTGKLGNYTHTLVNTTKARDVSGTKTAVQKEIERLVGLSFEQFTRSVLLAQGDFTAFLKADKEEKSALLEKLTGSQIYSAISKNIYEHYKTEEQKLKDHQSRAANIDLLTAEQITILHQEIASRQQEQQTLEREKTSVDLALQWHAQKSLLEAKLSEASQLQQSARQAAGQLTDLRHQLRQAQTVSPLKTIQDTIEGHEHSMAALSLRQSTLASQAAEIARKKNLAAGNLLQVSAQKEAAEKALKAARPLLSKAVDLDAKIQAAQQQLEAITAIVRAASHTKATLERDKQALASKLETHTHSLAALQDWIRQREDRSKIADSTELITSRLQEAAGLRDSAELHRAKISDTTLQTAVLQAKIDTLNTEIAATQSAHTETLRQSQALSQKMKAADIGQLETQSEAAQNKDHDLNKSQLQWEQLENSLKEYEAASRQAADNTAAIGQLTADVKILEPAVSQLDSQVNTTRELIAKASLRHAENVEKLRAGLKDNTPCPVCGSLEHPYALNTHTDLADQLLHSLTTELTAAEQAFTEKNKEYTGICSSLALREAQQPALLAATQNKQALLTKARAGWAALPFFSDLKDMHASAVQDWLSAERRRTGEALRTLQAQKSAARENARLSELLSQTTVRQQAELQALKDQQSKADASLQIAGHALQTDQGLLAECNAKLKELQTQLSSYFPGTDWYNNWQTDPAAFTGAIEKFAADWKAKRQNAERLTQEIQQLTTETAGFDRQLKGALQQLELHQTARDNQQKTLEALQAARTEIFEGRGAAQTEASLQQTAETAAQDAETLGLEAASLEKDWTALQLDKGILDNTLLQHQTQIQTLDQKITGWLDLHNSTQPEAALNREQLRTLLALSDQWLQDTAAKISQTDLQLRDSNSKLEERENDLKAHLATIKDDRDPATLSASQMQYQSVLESIQEAILERRLSLENHQKNQQKLGSFQKEIDRQQQVFDGWAALNTLLGSKDGRKFREVAQQYTLDLLLRYANQHLQVLSKRYVLSRIQESLAIQVIDRDMADEIRSVYSLSGGESFLVSLALALALASLSSHRLKVESLFIDEGFGSLDPTTLSIAMDALERLQDQGRKVGVISHVQEMTERISVQIRVHKRSSGKSNITVATLT